MAQVSLVIDGVVARVTLSNVERFNAMTFAMWGQLQAAFEAIETNDAIRVVVLCGDGDKSFVSGADISEFDKLRNSQEQVAAYEVQAEKALHAVAACRHPVVAAIYGVCMGGGLALAAMADLRYANTHARFRMPAARIGVGYDFGGMKRFVDLIGAANTAEIFYTAKIFGGQEAQRIGFIHQAFDEAAFEGEVEAIIQTVAGNAPLPMRAAKMALQEIARSPDAPDVAKVNAAVQVCFDSADYLEGRTAFMEKRAPNFIGK